MIKIYHNPRCQKSRIALKYLEESGEQVKIIEYLKDTPSLKELKDVLGLLKLKPIDIVRKKEALYIDTFKNKSYTDAEWLKILVENPILIERPIIVKGSKAIIARDELSLKKI
jgi:arsenate reductase (glutaredoxin)